MFGKYQRNKTQNSIVSLCSFFFSFNYIFHSLLRGSTRITSEQYWYYIPICFNSVHSVFLNFFKNTTSSSWSPHRESYKKYGIYAVIYNKEMHTRIVKIYYNCIRRSTRDTQICDIHFGSTIILH